MEEKPREVKLKDLGKQRYAHPGDFIIDHKNERLLRNVSGKIIRLPYKKRVFREDVNGV